MPSLYISIAAISLSLSTALAELSAAIVPNCYFPDGSLFNSSDYRPCNKGANVRESMCCAIANRSGDDLDVCVSNGLCKSSGGTYYRAGCTDETWESEACLHICMGSEDYMSSNAPVYFCDDGTVCCGNEAVAEVCCQKGKGFQLPTIGLSRITETVTIKFQKESSTSISSPTSTPTTIDDIQTTSTVISPAEKTNDPTETTSATPPTSTSSSEKGPPLPDTVKIAIAISVPAVSISLIITGILLWDRRRRRNPVANKKGIRITFPPHTKSPVAIEIGSSDTRYEWPTAGQLEQYARAYVPSDYNHRPPTPVHRVNVYEMY